MKKHIASPQGLTLVELLISLALAASLLTAMFGLLSSSLKTGMFDRSQIELQQTARIALDMMVRELRFSRTVSLPDSTSLAFTVPRSDGSYDTIHYFQDSDGILRRNHGGGNQPVTGGNGVKVAINLSWADTSQRIICLALTATDEVTGRSYTLQTKVLGLNIP